VNEPIEGRPEGHGDTMNMPPQARTVGS
jgi:hypothetical protein